MDEKELVVPKQTKFEPSHAAGGGDVWVVVADAGRARMLLYRHAEDRLEEQEDLVEPEARLQDHEAVSDRKGRATQGVAGIGQSFEPRHTHAEHLADEFAKRVCKRLDAVREAGTVAKIYLIAAPSFLGHLRKHLDAATRALVVEEVAADLSRRPAADIRGVLPARP